MKNIYTFKHPEHVKGTGFASIAVWTALPVGPGS